MKKLKALTTLSMTTLLVGTPVAHASRSRQSLMPIVVRTRSTQMRSAKSPPHSFITRMMFCASCGSAPSFRHGIVVS